VLIFAIAHLAALIVIGGLQQVDLSVPPAYLYGRTVLWSAGGLISALGLFTGRRWAPAYTKWLAVVYTLWYWVDRLTLAASSQALQGWGLSALVMGLFVVCIWWSLSRDNVLRFFRSTVDE
jgi:hypothetical protein